ncbi:MAG: hypothetical protein BWX80_02869 [Candidatus Hydrogenedentes bacterium ADurb.Bin101]|nr:MAG: hypothetical protein BWX80_02869 [Candidatus Hydrogenedentes bacterium ADurb.Bin101]
MGASERLHDLVGGDLHEFHGCYVGREKYRGGDAHGYGTGSAAGGEKSKHINTENTPHEYGGHFCAQVLECQVAGLVIEHGETHHQQAGHGSGDARRQHVVAFPGGFYEVASVDIRDKHGGDAADACRRRGHGGGENGGNHEARETCGQHFNAEVGQDRLGLGAALARENRGGLRVGMLLEEHVERRAHQHEKRPGGHAAGAAYPDGFESLFRIFCRYVFLDHVLVRAVLVHPVA